MKRDDLFKFGLSIICAAVLSACSSGGGSSFNQPNTGSQPNVQQPDNGGKKDEGKKDEEKKDDTKQDENKTGETKDEAKKDGDILLENQPIATGKAFVGYKHVTKNGSDFIINKDNAPNGANIPTAMKVQGLFPSLDTVVVAEQEDAKPTDPSGYLEDFDFRGNEGAADGKFVLDKIYLGTETERPGTKEADVSEDRPDGATPTKTATRGLKSGTAFVYQTGRRNYTNDYNGIVLTAAGETDNSAENKTRFDNKTEAEGGLKGSLAEVYGYRTFANAGELTQLEGFTDKEQPNLPLVEAKDEFQKAQLKNVQYGRVTTALNGHVMEDFKQGKQLGSFETFVVPYGQFGDKQTENHYFYRGINPTEPTALQQLTGKLKYVGHAVSYGLNNGYMNEANFKLPNALGGNAGLISGNHVEAFVDFGQKVNNVTGRIYNQWYVSVLPGKTSPSDLVSFDGTLAANGNIAGTATRLDNQTKGVFGATLFGDKAQEMGGSIASNDKEEGKRWGAVFGAVRVMGPAPAVVPPVGKPGKKLGDLTNRD